MQGASVNQAGEQRSARIESLRAVAALGVLVGHVYGASHAFAPSVYDGYARRVVLGGGFGVFLFFALTGYLLFWPFLKESFRGGGVDLRSYARNRALRILPLYYAVVVILLLVREHGGSFGQWWRFLTFSENFSHATIRTVDGVVWSLVIELQFYVLLPVLAWVLLRLARGSLARVAGLLLFIGGASLALRLAFVTFKSVPDPLVQFSLPTTFFFFIAGMLVAVARLVAEGRPLAHRGGHAAAVLPARLGGGVLPLFMGAAVRRGGDADGGRLRAAAAAGAPRAGARVAAAGGCGRGLVQPLHVALPAGRAPRVGGPHAALVRAAGAAVAGSCVLELPRDRGAVPEVAAALGCGGACAAAG